MIIAVAVCALNAAPAADAVEATTLIPEGERVVFLGVRPQSEVAESTARSVSELLVTELHRHADVISESDVEAMLTKEVQRQALAGCAEDSCLAEVGMALGASFLVSGTVGMVGDRAVLTVKLINTHEVSTVARASAAAASMGDLVGREAQLVRELLGIDAPGAGDLTADAVARGRRFGAAGIAGISVAGVGLVSGVVLGLLANSKASEARDFGTPDAATLDDFNDASDRAESLALGADLAFGAALVGAAILVVDLFLLDHGDPASAVLGTDASGLVVRF